MDLISLELLSDYNIEYVCQIQRDDISEAFVDTVDTIMGLTQYGLDHNCKGHTYAIKRENEYIGLILLGEAFEWDTDPEEMKGVPFYRLMGFVIDKRYRSSGIGGYVLEKVIELIYDEFGIHPIALGVHKDNIGAERFYLNHGFQKTAVMEGNDYYYLRYPPIQIEETLRLRRFDGNYDFAFEWYQDPETVLLVDGKAEPYSHETLTNMYNYLNSKGELYFIEVNENGEWKPIGDVTFWQEDMPIVIGEREYRGKGIGKKVVSALVERGKAMGYDKLYVGEIYDFNICSQKCFESVGFRSYEKTEKGSRYVLNLKELKEL